MTRGLGRFLRRNTIALLALFLALGGTSYAAATLINGSQIKPHTIAKNKLTNKAIKQLRGNRGPQGAQGAQGIQGAKGATGPAGPITGDLPGGVTLRGNYMTAGNNGNTSGTTLHSAVSFGLRLSAAPTVHYITAGSPPPAQCPGSVTDPQAAAGNLCVYEITAINATSFRGVCNPESGGCPANTANREGFAVYAADTTAGNAMYVFGSWAVTAPAGSSSVHAPHAGVATIR